MTLLINCRIDRDQIVPPVVQRDAINNYRAADPYYCEGLEKYRANGWRDAQKIAYQATYHKVLNQLDSRSIKCFLPTRLLFLPEIKSARTGDSPRKALIAVATALFCGTTRCLDLVLQHSRLVERFITRNTDCTGPFYPEQKSVRKRQASSTFGTSLRAT